MTNTQRESDTTCGAAARLAAFRSPLAILLWLAAVEPAVAQTTYYVRLDGGTATQCTGTTDAPYPGTGVGRPCAWNHPFWALPPQEVGPALLAGGDTLMIGAGSYRIGIGAPNTAACDADGAFICTLAQLPSGPSAAQPTRILGAGWDTGCTSPPELWGAERVYQVIDLTDTSHALISCVEITDHSSCIEDHTGALTCERDTPPFGPWGDVGLYAEDSSDVTLRDLNIHGLSGRGVLAGRLTDWTIEDVSIHHNGYAGWDGDIDGADSNSGSIVFRRVSISWNGCGETYPGSGTTGCWSQTAGGYGDGLGTGETAGSWLFEDCEFLYNTSDGLDLLYVRAPGTVDIVRTRAAGNAGNQMKATGDALITDSVIVGNCASFNGKPFTFNVDDCRAQGNALSLFFEAGTQSSLLNSTLYSQGDCVVLIGNGANLDNSSACNGSESLLSRNNVFVGDTDFFGGDQTCFAYNDGCGSSSPLDQDYGVIFNVKNNPCPGGNDVCADPRIVNGSGDAFDGRLLTGSPALDSGLASACSAFDSRGMARPQDGDGNGTKICDRGAFEASRVTNLALADETIVMRRTYEACESISATTVRVLDVGRATFEAANRIALGNGFRIDQGGELTGRLRKPSACP